LKIFICGSVSLNLKIDDNHWVPGNENMVGGTFLSKPIQVQQLVKCKCTQTVFLAPNLFDIFTSFATNVPQNITSGVHTEKFSARSIHNIVVYPILKIVALFYELLLLP